MLPVGYNSAPLLDNVQDILIQKIANRLGKIAFATEGAIIALSFEEVFGGDHE